MIDDLILKRTEYVKHAVTVINDTNVIDKVIKDYNSKGWSYGDCINDSFNGKNVVILTFTKDMWEEELIDGKLCYEDLTSD